ncbi:TetR/AcrR family transcriptional regulator [Jiangella gansuensis]|uniref:TetR/AcrR family transcriptional regulator n=1 Tax=Jiangella gansuensis TaxID=281473 RepID=UPI0004B2CA2E|nr:TetR/AcrR family transcriptional regulator [Jiangella gansuensis]
MTTDDYGLSRALQSAWGIAPAPTKGPRPRLSLEQIVTTAVELGDRDGVDAITMSGVAKRLGSGVMSLYRYVESREDLLILAADAALASPPSSSTHESLDDDDGWRVRTAAWATAMRRTYQAHPWLTALPITSEPLMPSRVRWLEAGLACLAGSGLGGAEAISVVTLLWTYIRGDVELGASMGASVPEVDDVNAFLAGRLRAMAPPGEFPRMLAILDGEVAGGSDDTDFELAIDVILAGVAARAESADRLATDAPSDRR